jgi:hypothetical protein
MEVAADLTIDEDAANSRSKYFERGFVSTETEVARITKLLGHKPRSYEESAVETALSWKS